MTEIRLHIHHTIPDFFDLFELELAKHNLTMRINEGASSNDTIVIIVETKTEAEDDLVRELATLCFAHAYDT